MNAEEARKRTEANKLERFNKDAANLVAVMKAAIRLSAGQGRYSTEVDANDFRRFRQEDFAEALRMLNAEGYKISQSRSSTIVTISWEVQG